MEGRIWVEGRFGRNTVTHGATSAESYVSIKFLFLTCRGRRSGRHTWQRATWRQQELPVYLPLTPPLSHPLYHSKHLLCLLGNVYTALHITANSRQSSTLLFTVSLSVCPTHVGCGMWLFFFLNPRSSCTSVGFVRGKLASRLCVAKTSLPG